MGDSRHQPDQPTPGHHQAGLLIQTQNRMHCFPWSQFLFAEGDAERVRLAFGTHDVNARGQGSTSCCRISAPSGSAA